MAAEKGGIAALFSSYGDDDDDDEEEHDEIEQEHEPENEPDRAPTGEEAERPIAGFASVGPSPARPPRPFSPFPAEDLLILPSPHRTVFSAPPQPATAAPVKKGGAVAIVDYEHDEMTMSPEPEEGEIMNTSAEVAAGAQFQVADGGPLGTVDALISPDQRGPSQPSHISDQDPIENNVDMEVLEDGGEDVLSEKHSLVSTDVPKVDPLSRFLPPPVDTKCSEELQQKISKFLAYKKSGKSFNAEVRNRKDYRNPDFLQHAVRYQDIDQIGTCFSKDVFDPHGYEKCDYYDEIEADMKREFDRKEQERKKSPKVEFISGGVQSTSVAAALKTSTHTTAAVSSAPSSGLPPTSGTTDAAAKETRQNKKSKWDKIDGDGKAPGQDNLPTAGTHTGLLTAANAGSGYSAFAQLKRREAEEKKNDKKPDKRS